MGRNDVKELMDRILTTQGKSPVQAETQSLREAGFRSLDFSELALRVETALDQELDFDAALLRNIETVGDVLDFFEKVLQRA